MPDTKYNSGERFETLKSEIFSVIGATEAEALSKPCSIDDLQEHITNIHKYCCNVITPGQSPNPWATVNMISSGIHCSFGIKKQYNYDDLKDVIRHFIKEELDFLELILIDPQPDWEQLSDPYQILVTNFKQEAKEYTFEYPYQIQAESLKSKLDITDDEAFELILLIQLNKLKSLSEPDFVDIDQFTNIARRYVREGSDITFRATKEIIKEFAQQEDELFEEPKKRSIQKIVSKFLQQNPTEEFLNLLYSSHNNVDGICYRPGQIFRTKSVHSLDSYSSNKSGDDDRII